MKFKFLVVLLAVTAIGQLFSRSWAIKNGTDKDVYIRLTAQQDGYKVAAPIGITGKDNGVLLKKGESADGSNRFNDVTFVELIIADNQALTTNKHVIKLNKNDNINYTIQRAGKRYKLQDNNMVRSDYAKATTDR